MAQLQTTGITGSLTASGNLQVNGGNITTAASDLTLTPASTNIYLQGKVGITSELSVGASAAVAGQLLVSGTITTLSPTTVLNISASNSVNLAKNTTITGTLSSSGNITTAGDLAVNGGDITSTAAILSINAGGTVTVQDNFVVTGTLSSSGNITTAGNLNVNNGIIASIAANLRLTSSSDIILMKDTTINGTLTTTDDLFVNGGDAIIASTLKQATLNLSSSAYGGVINTYGSSSTSNLSFKVQDNQVMTLLNSPTGGAKLALEDPFSNGARYSIKLGVNDLAAFSADESGVTIGTITSTDFFLSTANVDRVKIGSSSADVTLLAGNLVFGATGKGIDFSANSSAAGMTSEILNDYEEGTWTPVFSGSTTAGSFNYTATAGTYTKIGNVVYFTCFIQVTATTVSGSGTVNITGLPFITNATGTGKTCFGAIGQYSSLSTNMNAVTWNTVPASSRLNFLKNTTESISLNTLMTHADLDATPLMRFSGFYYT